jgi:hypothetical protein
VLQIADSNYSQLKYFYLGFEGQHAYHMDLSLGVYGVYFRPVEWHLGISLTLWQWEGDLLTEDGQDKPLTDSYLDLGDDFNLVGSDADERITL